MKRTSTDPTTRTAPACWQRESTTACLRIELESGETHLLPYNRFITALRSKADDGSETLRIVFSSHEVDIQGHNLATSCSAFKTSRSSGSAPFPSDTNRFLRVVKRSSVQFGSRRLNKALNCANRSALVFKT